MLKLPKTQADAWKKRARRLSMYRHETIKAQAADLEHRAAIHELRAAQDAERDYYQTPTPMAAALQAAGLA